VGKKQETLECTPKLRHKNKRQFSRRERCLNESVVPTTESSSLRW
jgi:hypothetical protein